MCRDNYGLMLNIGQYNLVLMNTRYNNGYKDKFQGNEKKQTLGILLTKYVIYNSMKKQKKHT